MAISVRLDPRTEAILRRLSRLRGATKSQVIREALHALLRAEEASGRGVRPFEAMKARIGCDDGHDGHLAEDSGRKFSEMLSRRRGGGRT